RRLGVSKRQDPPTVMVEREGGIGTSHGQPLHHIEARGIFGPRATQELAARGHLVEQPLDPDPSAGRQRRRPSGDFFTMVDLEPPPARPPAPLSIGSPDPPPTD